MSAAVSVHLESASPLIDVPTVRDPEIRRVDGSVSPSVNVVGELQRKRTLAASRGFLVAARLSCML